MRQQTIVGAAVLIAALGAACGDGEVALPDAGAPDAAVDAGPTATAFVVSGDYAGTGVASVIEIPSLDIMRNVLVGAVADDPVLRYFDGNLYVINRFNQDNVVIIDARALELVTQISTGPGSNPQDVMAKGSTLYVPALGSAGILILDAAQPEAGVIDEIDLSELDPYDDNPDCNSVYLIGDLLYATCGVLDGIDPLQPGKVAVIDTTTNTLATSFDMETPNPFGFLQRTPVDSALAGDLLIGTVTFDDLTGGCVERIRTGAEPGSSCLVRNSAMGGFAGGYTFGAEDTAYIAVTSGYDAEGPVATLLTYDVTLGALADEPITPAAQRPIDVAQCPNGHILIADAAAGIRVYTTAGEELTETPIDIGLPPVARGMACY